MRLKTGESRRAARALLGKTIAAVVLKEFDPNAEGSANHDEVGTNPVIYFTDGSRLCFTVQETEVGEYGVKLLFRKK